MFKKKTQSMKLSEYFKVVHPTYKYIKITPHKSNRNTNSSQIAKAIASTYKSIFQRIRKEKGKLIVETEFKFNYIIDIQNNNASFYFMIPEIYMTVMLEKIREIWSKSTIEVVDPIKPISPDAKYYQISYKKEDAMSIDVNKKNNEPLNSLLGVMDVIKDDDRVTLIYNFVPSSNYGWKKQYNETMEKHKQRKLIDKRNNSAEYVFKTAITNINNFFRTILTIIGEFLGETKKQDEDSLISALVGVQNDYREPTIATKKKKDATILPTQVLIASESKDALRRESNAVAVGTAFRVLDEDNELIYKDINKSKKEFNIEDLIYPADFMQMSCEECGNFIQLPARTLLNQHKIKHINIEECDLPKELKEGYINLGVTSYKGNKYNVYTQDHPEFGSLGLMLIAQQGSGKTTYLENYCNMVASKKESLFVFDYIKNNEMSNNAIESIRRDYPNYPIVEFDLTKPGTLALTFEELNFKDGATPFERFESACAKCDLYQDLLDTINDNSNTKPLTSKMLRYFVAACNVVFINKGTTLKHVAKCLEDFSYRHACISNIPIELKETLEEDVRYLYELDDTNKEGEVVGTKDQKLDGILDRIFLIKRNVYLRNMFDASEDTNPDFRKLLDEGTGIFFKMPQSKFKKFTKNTICTFLSFKLWNIVEERGEKKDLTKTHLVIDELFQVKNAECYLSSLLLQLRKYRVRPVFTTHFLNKLEQDTVDCLKGGGFSYMLMRGTKQKDFDYIVSEFSIDREFEELTDMQKTYKYPSFNVIQSSSGVYSCITQLPKPVVNK